MARALLMLIEDRSLDSSLNCEYPKKIIIISVLFGGGGGGGGDHGTQVPPPPPENCHIIL